MQSTLRTLRYREFTLGLGLSMAMVCAACDEAPGEVSGQTPQAQSATAPGSQAVLIQQPGTKLQVKNTRPTGPDYIKTDYEPKVELGGLYTFDQLDIETHDGVTLEALVTEPTASGKHPLILMPGSWTMNRHEYEIPARQWASQGFVVISYTSRGFHGSGGEIDIAGTPTVQDLSSLIDWAGANTKADVERVGALGISYGGGTSLLAAAQDPRIDAVASMSGWTDLRFSNFPNHTGSGQSGDFLVSTAESSGRRGKVMKEIDGYIKKGEIESALLLMDERSPIKKIDAINKNNPAILIAHAWNDGIFPPRQVLRFFEKLTTPKQLLLQPGSHGSADGAGIAGFPDSTWKMSMDWMRKHVKGDDIVQGPPVVLVSNDNKWVSTANSVKEWEADKRIFRLGSPQGEGLVHHYGVMTKSSGLGWQKEIEGGHDTVAQSGTLLVSGAMNGLIGAPQIMNTTTVDRRHAVVWKSSPFLTSQNISGSPVLHLNVASPQENATMVAYLYESVAGMASLITYSPMTVRNLSPGVRSSVSFELEPTEWNLIPGSRLVLVVDTVDKRYMSETKKGQKIEFSSGSAGQATLEVPMRSVF